jgi:hypothetical protein
LKDGGIGSTDEKAPVRLKERPKIKAENITVTDISVYKDFRSKTNEKKLTAPKCPLNFEIRMPRTFSQVLVNKISRCGDQKGPFTSMVMLNPADAANKKQSNPSNKAIPQKKVHKISSILPLPLQ